MYRRVLVPGLCLAVSVLLFLFGAAMGAVAGPLNPAPFAVGLVLDAGAMVFAFVAGPWLIIAWWLDNRAERRREKNEDLAATVRRLEERLQNVEHPTAAPPRT